MNSCAPTIVVVDDYLEHGPIRITYHHVHHPGRTYGYRMEVAGKSIAYVPDHEYLFQARSLESRAHEFSAGHSCFIDAVNLAIDTEVRALYLYHHDPATTDADMDKIHAQSLRSSRRAARR